MGRKKQFVESVALRQALNLFWQRGYKQTSVAQLQKAMGLQKGSFYLHFRSKEKLFLRCLDLYRQDVVGARKILASEARDPKSSLKAFFGAWLDNVIENPSLAGCLNTNSLIELGRDDSELSQYLRGGLQSWEDFWSELFRHAPQKLQPKPGPGLAASLTVSFTQGLNVLARAQTPKSKLKRLIDSYIQTIFA